MPPSSPRAAVGSVAVAFVLNLGLQGRFHSTATFAAVCGMAALTVSRPDRRRPAVLMTVGLAVVAAAMLVIRASPWVTTPSFIVAVAGLATAARGGLPTGWGWWSTAVDYATDLARSLRWLTQPLVGSIGGGPNQRRAARGLVLAVIVVVPLASLLASADPVFVLVLKATTGAGLWTHLALTAAVLPAVAGLVLAGHRPYPFHQPGAVTRPGSMLEGSIVLMAVALLLGSWCVTQVVVAIGGAGRLLATAELTAAQNARQGFFQLVAVTTLLVIVMVAIDRYVERSTAGQRRRYLALTAVIGMETIGVVVATYSRLALYSHGFGSTMLRTAVAWFLAWLAVVMMVLIVAVNRRSMGSERVVGPLLLLAGLWVVAFGASNPEAAVARANLDRETGVALDARYLTGGLGTDAVAVIVDRLAGQQLQTSDRLTSLLCQEAKDHTDRGPWSWNLAERRARQAVDRLDCR